MGPKAHSIPARIDTEGGFPLASPGISRGIFSISRAQEIRARGGIRPPSEARIFSINNSESSRVHSGGGIVADSFGDILFFLRLASASASASAEGVLISCIINHLGQRTRVVPPS